jgi:hypothetical protein
MEESLSLGIRLRFGKKMKKWARRGGKRKKAILSIQ